MADNEIIDVTLPSGEEIEAEIPTGMSDAQAKVYMRTKRPELFSSKPQGPIAPVPTVRGLNDPATAEREKFLSKMETPMPFTPPANAGMPLKIATGVLGGAGVVPTGAVGSGINLYTAPYKSIGRAIMRPIDAMAGIPKALSIAAEKQAANEASQALTKAQNVSRYRELESANQIEREAVKNANISKSMEIDRVANESKAALDIENAANLQKYRTKVSGAIQERNTLAVLTSRREALERGANSLSPRIQKHLADVSDSVYANLQKRYSAIGSAVKGDIIDPQITASAVRSAAQSTVLPANIKDFRAIVKDAFGESSLLDWKNAQSIYTKLGKSLSGGGLPRDVYMGIKEVQSGIGDAMQALANKHGVGEGFPALRADYSKYMTDFKDVGAVSTGGSPIAAALRSPDSKTSIRYLAGSAKDRAREILARYKDFGANPDVLSTYTNLLEEASKLPSKAKATKIPSMPTAKTAREVTAVPYKAPPPELSSAPYTPPTPAPPVDVRGIKSGLRRELGKKIVKRGAVAAGAGATYEIMKEALSGGQR